MDKNTYRIKMGSRTVVITEREEEVAIYRDGKQVGTAPCVPFAYTVSGVCSGCAYTLEAAKARAEAYATDNFAHTRFSLSEADAVAYLELEQAHRDAQMAKFPFTDAERQMLLASRYHSDIVQGPSKASRITEFKHLTGGRLPSQALLDSWPEPKACSNATA